MKTPRLTTHRRILGLLATLLIIGVNSYAAEDPDNRPNILMVISDDQSWLHSPPYGDTAIRMPALQRLADQGVTFQYAYCASPSCSPSRHALAHGQSGWRLGSKVTHAPNASPDAPGFATDNYIEILQANGYFSGGVGAKAWRYSDKDLIVKKQMPIAVENVDYAASFAKFLEIKPEDAPFHYYFASIDGHRDYTKGSGLEYGHKLEDARVPPWLPDTPEIRSDILDYYLEFENIDKHLARMLAMLEELGELENTIVVYTSDNGMPFPRGKATVYDSGVRMPLVISWPSKIPGGRRVTDFVGLWDLAPTFLEAAGLPVPESMYGRSLLSTLESEKEGQVEPERDFVVNAREAHVYARPEGLYPTRSIRTQKWAYLRNYTPDRWPSGPENWPYGDGGKLRFRSEGFNDVGNSPSKSFLMKNREDPGVAPYFAAAFGMRPEHELYDMENDPGQINNLADDPAHAQILAELQEQMETHLRETGDPRALGEPLPWAGLIYLRRSDLRDLTPEFWAPFYYENMADKTYEDNCRLLQEKFGEKPE